MLSAFDFYSSSGLPTGSTARRGENVFAPLRKSPPRSREVQTWDSRFHTATLYRGTGREKKRRRGGGGKRGRKKKKWGRLSSSLPPPKDQLRTTTHLFDVVVHPIRPGSVTITPRKEKGKEKEVSPPRSPQQPSSQTLTSAGSHNLKKWKKGGKKRIPLSYPVAEKQRRHLGFQPRPRPTPPPPKLQRGKKEKKRGGEGKRLLSVTATPLTLK